MRVLVRASKKMRRLLLTPTFNRTLKFYCYVLIINKLIEITFKIPVLFYERFKIDLLFKQVLSFNSK